MDKTKLGLNTLIIFLLLLSSVNAEVQIQFSEDNSTWENLTNTNLNNKTGYQSNLQSDTTYYFRAKNDSTSFGYLSQKTKDIIQANDYYLYITIFLSFITLLSLYYYLEDSVFGMIAGMLIAVTALSIFNIGFPNLTNTLLKNGLMTILWGIGAYYIITPAIKLMQQGGYGQ